MRIIEKDDESTTTNEQPSSSSLANSDLETSLNTVKPRFISKIYTKYECLPSKPTKVGSYSGATTTSSSTTSSPVSTNYYHSKLIKSTASLVTSSSPTSVSTSTSTSSISSASISNKHSSEEASCSRAISARKGSTKVSLFMDNNNNNNQNMNKNEICEQKSSSSITSTALNDLNLTGVTWSVPNIRRQFEAKIKTTVLSSSNKLVVEERKEQSPILQQPIFLTHNSSNIYHFFKDINGNPTTYI